MGAKLKPLKPRRVLHALQRAGFAIHHWSGSHAHLRHPQKLHLRVTVPRHDRYDLPVPVLRSILRQAELSIEEFLALI